MKSDVLSFLGTFHDAEIEQALLADESFSRFIP